MTTHTYQDFIDASYFHITIDLSLGKILHVRHTIKACTLSAHPRLSLFPGISTILKMEHIILIMILAYHTNIHVFVSTI